MPVIEKGDLELLANNTVDFVSSFHYNIKMYRC